MNTEKMGQTLRELRGQVPMESVVNAVGISKSALSMYERGERTPRDRVKLRLARFYGKSVEFIFFNE